MQLFKRFPLTFQNAPAYLLASLAAIAALVGIWVRFYHLGAITTPIFDEVYFPVFAEKFLEHQIAFDVHPPLGKLCIAIGIWFFGNNGLGWRIIPALFGVGIVAITVWIWRQYSKSWVGAILLVLFLSLDGILIVYSRTGLIDGMLLFSIQASFGLALVARKEEQLLALATAIGLALSIKWIALGVVVPIGYIMWRRRLLPAFTLSLVWSAWVYFIVVLGGQIIGRTQHPLTAALQWHVQALEYHLKLKATHPWSSPWWSWPLELRPVLFYYQSLTDGRISTITALGNPLLWWSTSLAVVVGWGTLIWEKIKGKRGLLDHPYLPLLIGHASFWLPWSLVHRVVFLYHYLPAYFFAVLLLVFQLTALWRRQPWLVLAYAAAVTVCALYFLPLANGSPLTQAALNSHIWLHRWLYN